MRHAIPGLLAAFAFLACLAAAQAQPAAPSADPAAAPVEEQQVCVNQDAGGNSRLGKAKKVCHTQKEWDALHAHR